MQLVIEINEEMYKDMLNDFDFARRVVRSYQGTIADAIQNGVPLPKEHGRLIDAEALLKNNELDKAIKYGNKDLKQRDNSYSTMMLYEIAIMIEDAPTILEASKE